MLLDDELNAYLGLGKARVEHGKRKYMIAHVQINPTFDYRSNKHKIRNVKRTWSR